MDNQKQFGVWMDTHQATVVGNDNGNGGVFAVIAHVKGETVPPNSNEKSANNQEKTNQVKFFKEIAAHMVNATSVHITGTGQVQEQFLHYLANTPQFKNTKSAESTANKMSDEKLIEYIAGKLA
jgi:stalled ribosome rescue protein Dom34